MRERLDRRSFIWLGGASALAGAIAGCFGREAMEGERVEIEPGTRVLLDGYTSHWEGREPDGVREEENPVLVLTGGEPYEIEWTNADGFVHDLQIWNADDEVVEGLATEEVETESEGDSLEFTADERMETYVCEIHQSRQRGTIEVK